AELPRELRARWFCCALIGSMFFAMPLAASDSISLVLGGDVMTGRGIDQILPHPGDPVLYESYVRDARDYVALAEKASGRIERPVDFAYIWGDALPALHAADARIINLETSITRADAPWPAKGINYRMHPENIGCLTAAKVNGCSLANNHVLDWGFDGLVETLATLRSAGIACAGAGATIEEAAAPIVLSIPNKGRVLMVAVGLPSSGIPMTWAAGDDKAGLNLLSTLKVETARKLARDLVALKRGHDATVVSIHWGGNWGYEIPVEQIRFAQALVDEGVDVVHGHSSHHPKAIEFRRGGVILYGCGDFINDYEGIPGREEFRNDLALLYRITIATDPSRRPHVSVLAFKREKLRLNRAPERDVKWLVQNLNEQSAAFGTEAILEPDGTLTIRAISPSATNAPLFNSPR
ncbi:MAG TPA: CapA family protein, partial [Opitutus sp.]|nr:CapA family protein [Opitutus sp.]